MAPNVWTDENPPEIAHFCCKCDNCSCLSKNMPIRKRFLTVNGENSLTLWRRALYFELHRKNLLISTPARYKPV